MSVDNQIVEGINDKAGGIAQPTENFGAVEFNYDDSTKTVSCETLHLILKEMGYPKSCYVEAVHENANKYTRYDNVLIMIH